MTVYTVIMPVRSPIKKTEFNKDWYLVLVQTNWILYFTFVSAAINYGFESSTGLEFFFKQTTFQPLFHSNRVLVGHCIS